MFTFGITLFLTACESPSPAPPRPLRDVASTHMAPAPASAPLPQSSASVPPANPSFYNQNTLPPPDAEVLYRSHESDIFGSTSFTSRTQVRGPVVEETHIGNQRVYRSPSISQ